MSAMPADVVEIAVVGLACRLPGASGPERFWELLAGGHSAIGDSPAGRFPAAERGGFLDGVDQFDPALFGISPREAAVMDPQQRLALELGWEVLEDAGIPAARLRDGTAGVFVGATSGDYATLTYGRGDSAITHHTLTGLNRAVIANRVSHVLGLRGPSMTVDTAQSSSLVAVHLAAESLRRGETDVALAGGVNLNLSPVSTLTLDRFGGLSPDGECFTFDERANGFVRGEGGGLVLLKRLADAQADGDRVYCVLTASAVNNDGGDTGLTVPNGNAQRDLIRDTWQAAKLGAEDVQYVELHGTGTPVGDPIEGVALAEAAGTPMVVGSVKTNIGHLEAAAGIAGLLKTILAIHHRQLPATLNHVTPNPKIPATITVNRETGPWPRPDRPLTAGVSSFGVAGTNCHVVVSEPPVINEQHEERVAPTASAVPVVLSGHTRPALQAQAQRLREAITADTDLADLAYSLGTARTHLGHRAVVTAEDFDGLAAGLDAIAAGSPVAGVVQGIAGDPGRTVFVFPGQGSQWPGMAADLMERSPVFARRIEECERALAPYVDWSLTEVLREARALDTDDVAQCSLFAVMVSLAALWQSLGIKPDAVVGHSQGEIAAACVAGALSLEDAARVVALRSQALTELAGTGGMAAVALSAADIQPRLSGDLVIAAINGPASVTLSGTRAPLAELVEQLQAEGVRARLVPVNYASHCAHVEVLRDRLLAQFAGITPRAAEIAFCSTVTGELIDTSTLDADYWYRNLREPVRFAAALQALGEAGHGTFVECSPHRIATMDVSGILPPQAIAVGTLRRNEPGWACVLTTLARLHTHGVAVDWDALLPGSHNRIPLPTYAYQRERYWFSTPAAERPAAAATPHQSTVDTVRGGIAAVLGHGDARTVETARTFKDLGFDSVTGVELQGVLQAELGLPLPASLIYDYPSPDALVAHIEQTMAGQTPVDDDYATIAAPGEAIAIVGMACRFPGDVRSPEQLWQLVSDGTDAISGFPTDRGWDLARLRQGGSDTAEGGFLYDAAEFDAGFFGISPREALAMDPQQRLLMETSWEALERAGLDPQSLRGSRSGVFVGAMSQSYGPQLHDGGEGVDGHLLTGTSTSIASGRIAYTLGLEGPAITVDTACSASLVALHLATQSLRAGECSLALASGVSLMSSPGIFVEFSRQGGLSLDGRCRAFSDDANGTGWSEGVGVLVLERLSDAQRNGHQILAVVRGSAVNQDGASNGLTAPNGPSQQRVIRQALASAGLRPSDVDAVEAHGTGTRLGDPIEAQALLATYGQDRETPLWLGSLKSNIGHTQAAAGVAGVIKMVMAMRHGVLPQTLHIADPSSRVDWTAGNIELLTEAHDWPEVDRPRRVGVSSFGMSGTNAHVILEQGPSLPAPTTSDENAVVPWVLSSRTAQGLAEQAARLADSLADGFDANDIAFSLLTTRSPFEHRAVVIGADNEQLLAGVRDVAAGSGSVTGTVGATGKIAFVFPGQGSQWAGMAVELLDSSPVFAARIAECEAALSSYVDWSLTEVLRGGAELLERVDIVQPASWAVMVSLSALWRSFGVVPDAVVGHSQGEIAAAAVAGALSLEDAARVVALRSQAIRDDLAGRGGMVSVGLPAAEIELGDRVWVAAVNSATSTVVAGDPDALDELVARYEAAGVRVRRVPVDYASHTVHVELIEDRVRADLAPITPRTSEIPFFSTVTADWADTTQLDAGYWYTNLRQTVRFNEAVNGLVDQGFGVFVESSAHPVLAPVIDHDDVVTVGSLRRNEGNLARFLTSAGELWARGIDVTWPVAGRVVDLPTYAFQHSRFWLDSGTPAVVESTDDRFWQAVERDELADVAGELDIDAGALTAALTTWRERWHQKSTVDNWRYSVAWKPLSLPAGRLDGTWLVIVPADAAGEISTAFDTASVVRVVVDNADRAALAERLRALGTHFSGVFSLLAHDRRPDREHPTLSFGVTATLALAQALGDAGIEAPLWVATSGAVTTGKSDPITDPAQALLWGLGRVIALEHPTRWGGLVDLPEQLDKRAADRLCSVLASTAGEDQVAIRANGIHGRRLIPSPAGTQAPARTWRPRGTTLITGGTGALGVRIARWLAGNGAEHLVLLSRKGGAAEGMTELAAELDTLGTRVTFAACDITDRDSLSGVLTELAEHGDEVRSVVHAAGLAPLGTVEDLTAATVAEVAATKVAGTLLLDELLTGYELDAFVLFSSISGTWGVADHAAYAMSNAFLDAFAWHGRQRGVPLTSVAWGPWAGGGMIAEELQDVLRRRGIPVIDPEPAITGLQQALDHDDTVIAVADVDWDRFVPTFTSSRPSPLLAELVSAPAEEQAAEAGDEPALRRRIAGLAPAEIDRTLVEFVREHTAKVLGHTDLAAVAVDRAFKELGFDSLTSVDLRNAMTAASGLRLPATIVFDNPTPVALAGYLRTQLLGSTVEGPSDAVVVTDDEDPIAIVSMSCRLPGGVRTPEDLWSLVVAEADVISGFPTNRGWNLAAIYDADPSRQGTTYVRAGGFLYDSPDFDAEFFGISPREALAMDPQQRLLLETSWEAFERAGIDPKSLRGSRTGVFIGLNEQHYGAPNRAANAVDDGYLLTGDASSVGSGRISYALGLEGPSISLDTACSSSLVSLHLAAQAIRGGECELAVAGGAMVMATPSQFFGVSRQRGLAADGRCKAFSADADGTGLAEGAGVVVVERLSRARELGHPVLAVLRGSAVNSDGASNGLTAPNGNAQQRVIRQALSAAGLRPSDVDAVEAHGTGTKLGDPIEAQALIATYGQDRTEPLWVGSVKTNIGHTQTAAGVAGIIKMVMALRHGVLPKSLYAEQPSPHVDWEGSGVQVLNETIPWPATDRPHRAAVSAFGISGTNAHVIIEQAPAVDEPETQPVPGVTPLVLSARSEQALRAQAANLASRVDGLDLTDVGWSLATTRSAFEHRAVVFDEESLRALASGEPAPGVVEGFTSASGRTVFVFPGQGAQWAGMAVELLDSSPVFAQRIAECEAALAPHVDWSLTEVLHGDPALLERVDVLQPLLWAVMVSMAELWRSIGVVPDAVVGTSQGEVAAACVAGALSLEDSAKLSVVRAMVTNDAMDILGGLATIALPADEIELGEGVWVAVVNSATSTVVGGQSEAIDEFVARYEAAGVRVRRMPAAYASHTPLVEPIHDRLVAELASITPLVPQVPFFSTATADWIDTAALDGEYWYTNLRQPVRFHDAVTALAEQGFGVFVEPSTHPVLISLIDREGVITSGSVRRNEGSLQRFFTSAAELWTRGVPIRWDLVFDGRNARRVDLPTYPFQRERFWLADSVKAAAAAPAGGSGVDASFWAAVEDNDLDTLAGTLGVDSAELNGVLPALSSWYRNQRTESTVDDWLYRIDWRPLSGSQNRPYGDWIAVVPEVEIEAVTTLLDRLRAQGMQIMTSTLSTVDFLMAEGVLSLLGLDTRPHPDHPELSVGVVDTMRLITALAEAGTRTPLWCVTSGAVSIDPSDLVTDAVQASLWGAAAVLSLDEPDRWGGIIDVPAVVDDRIAGELCAALADGSEDQVAIRAGGRFARRMVRAAETTVPHRKWQPRGTVLVTGGTGAIGGHVARWLAANGAEHVVLTSRSGSAAPGAAELEAELVELGARVTIAACDVSDRAALVELLDSLGEPVTAVMHTAGLVQEQTPTAEVSIAEFAEIGRAKRVGATNLDELLGDLDAFVLFSSGASTWGSSGVAAYASANGFLDGLAHRRRARGATATSVAWGAWGGGGMVHEDAAEHYRKRGVTLMAPELAVAGLQRALDADATQLVVAKIEWDAFGAVMNLAGPRPLLADIPEATPAPVEVNAETAGGERELVRRLTSLPADERLRVLTGEVRDLTALVIGQRAESLRVEKPFKELGFDSLTSVELRNRLNALTGCSLPATVVFDHPTPQSLAAHVLELLLPPVAATDPLDELDRLEEMLINTASDAELRTRVQTRLRELMAKWGPEESEDEEFGLDMDSASDDEIFDLIDRELGVN
ncbi:type I polyketide synthase [Kutzneria sp. NPDC052558]|uniref:type I polyketide synthase n=1 Tax=Kutzneria sp. NPDC052558 TaxID=3364121 RepID=UPI0037C6A826